LIWWHKGKMVINGKPCPSWWGAITAYWP